MGGRALSPPCAARRLSRSSRLVSEWNGPTSACTCPECLGGFSCSSTTHRPAASNAAQPARAPTAAALCAAALSAALGAAGAPLPPCLWLRGAHPRLPRISWPCILHWLYFRAPGSVAYHMHQTYIAAAAPAKRLSSAPACEGRRPHGCWPAASPAARHRDRASGATSSARGCAFSAANTPAQPSNDAHARTTHFLLYTASLCRVRILHLCNLSAPAAGRPSP
jgi:hypothetical protein